MAAEPIPTPVRVPTGFRLSSFDAQFASLIASWVRDPLEAYWLAPRTRPPITATAVLNWSRRSIDPLMLAALPAGRPAAYGELNILNARTRTYWLGHLLVDPGQRGAGLGRELTQRLLERALRRYGARRVTLVVFEENVAAVQCYRAAGMRKDGYETHFFPAYRKSVRLLRMAALAWRWRRR